MHEVGYRTFMMGEALNLGVQRFAAFNIKENGDQVVVVLVEGNDKQIAAFKEFAKGSRPELAEVSNIEFPDFDGHVMSMSEYSQFNMSEQLNKGIPALLRMDKKQDKMLEMQEKMLDKQDRALEKQGEMLGKLDEVREDIVGEIRDAKRDEMQH